MTDAADAAEQPLEYEPEKPPEPEPEPPEEAADDEEREVSLEPPRLIPEARAGGAPGWVRLPSGLRFPRGRQVMFIRYPSIWTDTPGMGQTMPDAEAHEMAGKDALWRQCICWPLSVGDQKLAVGRAMGDGNRISDELTKQMIRAIDGHEVDWSGMPGPGNIDVWWDQIGGRCRGLLNKIFAQLHILSRQELQLFFERCIAVRSAG